VKPKTSTPAPTRRLRWLGGPEPTRYIPGVPARDLEESDLDRLDWIRSQGNATPVEADLVASGLYEYDTEPDAADFPRGNDPGPVTPEDPAPDPAEQPATTSEE
jgi:hypothetical protein